ncbi:hypothetical protein QL285_056786 [Trifolium repens]|nr:hypothetical protein QL285_056786 [Trifolium repens]
MIFSLSTVTTRTHPQATDVDEFGELDGAFPRSQQPPQALLCAVRRLSYKWVPCVAPKFAHELFPATTTTRYSLPHSEVLFNFLVIFHQSFLFHLDVMSGAESAIASINPKVVTLSFSLFVSFDITSLNHNKF